MTQLYFAKSVTATATGVVSTAWAISSFNVNVNLDPTKITFSVGVVGYVTPEAIASKLNPVPGTRFNYQLNAANFAAGKDPTTVSVTDLYNAILAYITTKTTDPLAGATLQSV